MTKVLRSSHIEKLGIAEVERVCARARMIFRRTISDDIGIDGLIEIVEEGIATGILIGVQIKSGDSFVSGDGSRFTFRSDQEHFAYWARCSFPVIAVIYSPHFEKAGWLDLTSLCSDSRILNGPYSETLEFTEATAFTAAVMLSEIVAVGIRYTHQRRTLWQIKGLLQARHERSNLLVPTLQVSSEKEAAWFDLLDIFLSINSSDYEVADAGYRLSWYFPTVSAHLQEGLKDRLVDISDFTLTKILCSVHLTLEEGHDNVGELIVDLLTYIPNISNRIESLLQERKIPSECKEAAIQAIEVIEQGARPDLRDS